MRLAPRVERDGTPVGASPISGTTEGNATVRDNINDRRLATAPRLAVLAGVLLFAAAAFQPVRAHLNPDGTPIIRDGVTAAGADGAAGPGAIVITDPPGPGQGPKMSLDPGDPPVITR
jgi:hypothetical protein